MSRRACAALALLGYGLLLLTTTQPWLRTVTELAAGAPRARGAVTGAELVPWLAPVAVVTALVVVAGLAGMRYARPAAGIAALAVLAGGASGVLAAPSGGVADALVVSAVRTGWLWVGGAAALVASVATVLWWRPWSRGTRPAARSSDAGPAVRDPDGAEAERRRAAADWRDLSEGRDPTEQ